MKAKEKKDVAKQLLGLSLERFAASARADFRFAPLNALLLVVIFVAGLAVHLVSGGLQSIGGLHHIRNILLKS